MEAKRLTLWMLDCGNELVPLYAVDEKDGWEKAAEWVVQHTIQLPKQATEPSSGRLPFILSCFLS